MRYEATIRVIADRTGLIARSWQKKAARRKHSSHARSHTRMCTHVVVVDSQVNDVQQQQHQQQTQQQQQKQQKDQRDLMQAAD